MDRSSLVLFSKKNSSPFLKKRSKKLLSNKMAGDGVALVVCLQQRRLRSTAGYDDGAAGVEAAAGRRVHRGRDIALQHDPLAARPGVRDRGGGDEGLSVGMQGGREELGF